MFRRESVDTISCLHACVKENNAELVQLLIENGADVNRTTEEIISRETVTVHPLVCIILSVHFHNLAAIQKF